ncbi:MAG: WD40 repeat domain-containing protein, partial [Spirillospora sp.]
RTPAAAGALARLAADEDGRVRATVREALTGLDDPASIDAVCEVLIETGHADLAELAADTGYLPSCPERRALLLFLTGRFDEYAELDFDGALLTAARAVAGDALRARLAARARESARVEWVSSIAGARGGAMSDPEWEVAIGILTASGRWDELWRLVTRAPPPWSARILRELDDREWRPSGGDDERAAFGELAALARACPSAPATGVFTGGTVELAAHTKAVTGLAVTPDGRLLVSSGRKGDVRLWHLPSGAPAGTIDHPYGVRDLMVFPAGDLLVTCGTESVQLWKLPSGEPADPARLSNPKVAVYASRLAMTPNGRILVSNGYGYLLIWRHPWDDPSSKLLGYPMAGAPIAVTGAGGGLAFWGDEYGRVRIFRPGSVTPAYLPNGHRRNVTDLAVTHRGDVLASAGRDGTVRLWRLPSGEPAGVLTGHETPVEQLAVTPDDRMLVSGDRRGSVRLWRLPSGEPARTLTGHEARVRTLAVSADGALLATGDLDGTIRLWHLPSGDPAGIRSGHPGGVGKLVFSPDGTLLACAGRERSVRLWRLRHPALRTPLRTPVSDLDLAAAERLAELVGDGPDRPWTALIG